MMMFFMLSGAFRAAGDPRTPLRLGVAMTVLTIVFNVLLIPDVRHGRRRARHDREQHARCRIYGIWRMTRPSSVIHFERGMNLTPGLHDHPVALPLRPADRRAGHRDERRRRAAAALHRLARAQRGGAGGLCRRLHRAVLADHLDVGRADGRRRRRSPARTSGAGNPERALEGVQRGGAHRARRRRGRRRDVPADSRRTCSASSA